MLNRWLEATPPAEQPASQHRAEGLAGEEGQAPPPGDLRRIRVWHFGHVVYMWDIYGRFDPADPPPRRTRFESARVCIAVIDRRLPLLQQPPSCLQLHGTASSSPPTQQAFGAPSSLLYICHSRQVTLAFYPLLPLLDSQPSLYLSLVNLHYDARRELCPAMGF